MQRRFFLTSIGLGFLASISLDLLMAIAKKTAANAKSVRAIAFYVATNGKDSGTGTEKSPFATLKRAQQAVRELRQQGLKRPVTVLIRGGTYYLSEPLAFTPEDSGTQDFPITYKAYPGEQPIISGGQAITGNWQRQGNIWTVNLPEVKAGWFFRLLRLNEDWATRSRYPKLSQDPAKNWLYAQNPAPIAQKQGKFNSGVSRIHHQGDRLEWDISATKSAQYQVWMRYSNNMRAYGLENMSGRTSLKVKGQEPILLDNLLNTGSFEAYGWQQVGSINLTAGKQRVIWENVRGGGLGIDAFVFTTDRQWNLAETFASKSSERFQDALARKDRHSILVHAETFKAQKTKELALYPENLRTQLTMDAARFPKWQTWKGGEVEIFPDRGWVNAILPIEKRDPSSKTIFLRSKQDIKPGNRFCIYNTKAALTSPNEWCLNARTGDLSYYSDGQSPQNKKLVAPKLDRLITLEGSLKQDRYVEYLHFIGLTFKDTNYTLTENYYFPADAAIWLSAARQCSIRQCNFTHLGGHGIRLQEGSNSNRFLANKLTQLGQGGIIMWGNNDSQPRNNRIINNRISNCGLVYKHVAGVYLVVGSGNTIAHNQISKMPRYGISLKSFSGDRTSHNNIIEFNRIINTCLETSDTGAIETLGRDKQLSGNIIRHNFIRNVVGMLANSAGEIVSPYYTWGIYLDDYSSGTKVYGNIVVGTFFGGVMIHGGRKNSIQNNIFVNGTESQIQISPKDNFMRANIVTHNIFAYQQGDAKLWRSNGNWRLAALKTSDYNCYWCASGNDWTRNQELTPAGTLAQWKNRGYDRNSILDKPPFWQVLQQNLGQIEPEDFQFSANNNSLSKINFQPIPVAKIGVGGNK